MLKLLNNRFLSSLYTLAILLTLNWFLPIFDSLLAETSAQARVEIVAYLAAVLALELLAWRLVTRYYRGFAADHVRPLFLAVILTVNVLGLLLSFYDPFLTQRGALKAIEIVLLMGFFYWLCAALTQKKFVIGALSLLYIAVVGQQLVGLAIAREGNAPGPSAFGQFKNVTFANKPNVYIVSFDSLIPAEIASAYLGLETLDYVSALKEKNARFFRNTFSDHDATTDSLNSVLYLDPAVWASKDKTNAMAFSGLTPSPVFEIFKSNGYKINTAFAGNDMLRGKYIDEFTARAQSESYCQFALPWYYLQHLGYCAFKRNVINEVLTQKPEKGFVFNDRILENFKNRLETPQPWLSFVYIYAPGHTPRNYSHTPGEQKNYTENFAKNQHMVAQYMRSLIDLISVNDPTGIVVIFGDHGAWLSRALELNDANAEFIVQDRHAVLSAIYPGDACSAHMALSDKHTFTTPTMLMRQLITCLSDGVDPIDWDVDYSGPYEAYKFESFVYE